MKSIDGVVFLGVNRAVLYLLDGGPNSDLANVETQLMESCTFSGSRKMGCLVQQRCERFRVGFPCRHSELVCEFHCSENRFWIKHSNLIEPVRFKSD
jgi:hypothetical protein